MFWSPLFLPYGHNVSVGDNRRPWVTIGLIALCVLSFLGMRALQWHGDSLSSLINVLFFADDRTFESFYFEFGLIPAHFASLNIFGIAGRLVWATFMHSGVAHLLTNMCFLAALGPSVERRLGSLGFLAFYLVGGIFGNILQVWSEPASDAVIMGASGAVASVFAAFLLWFPRARLRSIVFLPILNLPIPLPGSMPVWLFFAMMEAVQRLWGFWLTTVQRLAATGQFFGPTPQGAISEYAHLGGFIVGLAVPVALYLLTKYRKKKTATSISFLPVAPSGKVYAYSLSALTVALALFVLAVQSEYSWRVITESKQARAAQSGVSQPGAAQSGTAQSGAVELGAGKNESVADVIAGSLDKEKLKQAIETANQVLPGFIAAVKGQPQLLEPFKQVCKVFTQSGDEFLQAQAAASKDGMAIAAKKYTDAAAEADRQFNLLLGSSLGAQISQYVSLEDALGNYFSYKSEFSRPLLPKSEAEDKAGDLLLESFNLIYPMRATLTEAGLLRPSPAGASGSQTVDSVSLLAQRLKELGHAPTCED